jgi:integrase
MASIIDRNKNFPGRKPNLWIQYMVNGKPVRECANTSNRAAAERLAKLREREVAKGTWKPVAARPIETVEGCASSWVAELYARGVKSARDYESRLRDHILPTLGKRSVADVTREEIKELIATIVRAGEHAPRTVHNIYDTVRGVFAFALERNMITATPCTLKVSKKELPKKRDRDPDWRPTARFSREELELILSAPTEKVPLDRLTLMALQLLCGLRFGEAAGRKWSHYDASAQPLGRLRCATQYDGQPLKSDGNPREIPVHPVLAEILEE